MESDTPRTDAKDWMLTPAWAHPGQPLVEEERVVDAKFARELERELAAAKAQLVRNADELAAMRKQRNLARRLYSALLGGIGEHVGVSRKEGGGA